MAFKKGTKVYFKLNFLYFAKPYRKGKIVREIKTPNCRYKEYCIEPTDGQSDLFYVKASNVRRRQEKGRFRLKGVR